MSFSSSYTLSSPEQGSPPNASMPATGAAGRDTTHHQAADQWYTHINGERFRMSLSMGSRSETNNGEDADIVEVVLARSLKTRLSNVAPLTSERCIYRVPMPLREVKPEAYTPKLVSIGPFHRGSPRLQPMEVHKLRYLQDFLKRDPEKTIEFYIEKLKGFEERARQHYDEEISYLTSDEFVEMLLIDGCFIIEFMLRYREVVGPRDKTDFLWTAQSMKSHLKHDMRLLENQLPFFILECLFDLLNNRPDGQQHWNLSFLDLTIRGILFGALRRGQDDFLTKDPNYNVKHFVDLIRQSYVPTSLERMPLKKIEKFKFIPSATELHEAGVNFEKSSQKCFLDVKFNKISGVFSIPTLRVQHGTESFFRNLMALDFFHEIKDNYVSDYIIVMDDLINTSQDVALLRKSGIIDNSLGDDEEVSSLFNKLCTGVFTSSATFYYACLCGEVNAYYEKPWHVWRAKLKRDYFNTPWLTLSFIAAFIILICTMAQTVFPVIGLK